MKKNNYWIEMDSRNNHNAYRMRCPKCNRIFIMPKAWGVWKGCPVCWTELSYKKFEIN